MGEALDDMQSCNFIFEIRYLFLRCPSIYLSGLRTPLTAGGGRSKR
jgi:hypothetical protein